MLTSRHEYASHQDYSVSPAAGGGADAVRSLSDVVGRLVRRRTGGLLSDLRVDVSAEPPAAGGRLDREYAVVLTGRSGSYYGKQLAGAAAMAAAPGGVVRNRILVG